MPETDQSAWVKTVLGVDVNGTDSPPAASPWQSARRRWEAANQAVERQIAALQQELRQTDMEVLHDIAEFGMNGLTGDNKVKVMVSLIELGDGTPAAMRKSGRKALGAIGAFRAYLDSDERIAVCDDNPFGVPVAIRETLCAALADLQAAIEASLGALGRPGSMADQTAA